MQIVNQKYLDLEILPEEARKELLDFYKSILKKYKVKIKFVDDVDKFFDKYSLDLSLFKFNREEIHER